MYIKKVLFMVPALCLMLASCIKDEPRNTEADILQVSVVLPEDEEEKVFFSKDEATKQMLFNHDTLAFMVRSNADLRNICLDIRVSQGATITPLTNTPFDFSEGRKHTFTVTSEDGQWSRSYTISFQTPKNITSFSFDTPKMDAKDKFYVWDDLCSANEGFVIAKSKAAPDEYPTITDANGFIGSCIQLRTVDTGSWGTYGSKATWRPIAAGNLFFGSFDATKALTKTLQATRFGVKVNKLPKTFSGHYKYKAGAVVTNRQKEVMEGVVDKPAIYAVIYRNHDAKGNEIVLTGEDVLTSPYRVGLAKFHDIPETDTWTRFELKFEMWEEIDPEVLASMGYSLAMVCSASQNGDLFEGALGSTLWLDEICFTYDE